MAGIPRTRRWLQFRLMTLLLAFVPLAFGALWFRGYLDRRPVTYVDYSDAELQQYLDEGRTVLLHVTQNFSMM